MQDVDRWTAHSEMTDPGRHADLIAALPAEIGKLIDIIQGVLLHSDWVREYGLDETKLEPTSRVTLPIAARLDDILRREPQPLDIRRPPESRSIGTCRDYALVLCSLLRSRGVPARVRCGFAAYFSETWEDHWLCEYWDFETEEWHLSDPQIDEMLRRRNRIVFAAAEVPRGLFMSAGQAWLDCRRGKADPSSFGHGDVTGLWFVKINVLRDHHVLNNHVTSGWDRWREASRQKRKIVDGELALLDALAENPEQPLRDIAPDW